MFEGKFVRVAGLLAALILSACSSAGLLANEPSHIASIEVIDHDKGAPPAFAEILRQTMVREAAFYGDAGKPFDLKIDIDKVHFKNMLKAMLIGDDDLTKGNVTVVDTTTTQPMKPFAIQVDAANAGTMGFSIAETVIGAFDPTGLVSLATSAGDAASSSVFHNGKAAAMIDNFSFQALRGVFGDDKTRAVMRAKQQQKQQPKQHASLE